MNNEEPKILFAKVKDSAIIPSKEEENAGFDIYACWEGLEKKDKIIHPHQTKLIPTGIACALPTEYYFQVEERGSTGSKGIKKSAGVVDSGYRGEIFIAISNVNDKYLIFGEKEGYLEQALKDLDNWKKVDIDNLSTKDIADAEVYLKEHYEGYESLNENEKKEVVRNTYLAIQYSLSKEELTEKINNAIFYPENKAIAQLVLHKVDNLPIEEISYEELKAIPSKRGIGALGSSGK